MFFDRFAEHAAHFVSRAWFFLLVALLQNTQWRGDRATNENFDAIADGLSDTMESLAALMDQQQIRDHERGLLDQARELRETVGIEAGVDGESQLAGHDSPSILVTPWSRPAV